MPRLVDCHFNVADTLKEKMAVVDTQAPDDFGVHYLNVFYTADGHQFCVTDAANVNAVVGSHKAMGVQLQPGDVHAVWIGSLATS